MSGFNSNYTGAEVQSLLDKIKNFEGGGGKTAVVYHGTEDTAIELTPNVLHKWDEVTSLALTFPQDEEGYVNEYKVAFIAGEGFSLSVPLTMRWSNDEIPEFERGRQYELNIIERRILVSSFSTPMPNGNVLDFIESDGSDYVLTDVVIGDNVYGMRYKASPLFSPDSSNYYALAGARASSSKVDTPLAMWFMHGNGGRQLYYNGTSKTSFGSYAKDIIYEDEWEEQNLVSIAYPLAIFGVNSAGKVSYVGKFRFFGLQLLDVNNEALHDFRPFKKSDGTIGIIDLNYGIFYESVNGNLVGA